MKIGLHAPDGHNFPNLPLMKLSAWHKQQGDSVALATQPLFYGTFDKIYSSKVFTFTPEDAFLPDWAERHGTGYGATTVLPDEIEHIMPDYSLFPQYDYACGFLTRGCPNSCPWCIVPQKEGRLKPHAHFEEFARSDTNKLVFMDNNVLASPHGLSEIERLAGTTYRVDFNQGLDARLIAADESIAEMLASLRWLSPLRLACDKKSQMPSVEKAVRLLRKHGCKPYTYFCYCLLGKGTNPINDHWGIADCYERVMFLRGLSVDPFVQPYRDFTADHEPHPIQKDFARWVNFKPAFKSIAWKDYRRRFHIA